MYVSCTRTHRGQDPLTQHASQNVSPWSQSPSTTSAQSSQTYTLFIACQTRRSHAATASSAVIPSAWNVATAASRMRSLPDIELDVSAELSEFADVVAGGVAWINGVLPLAELLDAIDWVLVVYLPFVLVFHLVKWIYAHLPVVGGGS